MVAAQTGRTLADARVRILYFDFSFMVWTLLGVLGAQIAAPESLNLTAQQKFFMVSVPILAGGLFRLALGLLVDRIGAAAVGRRLERKPVLFYKIAFAASALLNLWLAWRIICRK